MRDAYIFAKGTHLFDTSHPDLTGLTTGFQPVDSALPYPAQLVPTDQPTSQPPRTPKIPPTHRNPTSTDPPHPASIQTTPHPTPSIDRQGLKISDLKPKAKTVHPTRTAGPSGINSPTLLHHRLSPRRAPNSRSPTHPLHCVSAPVVEEICLVI